ncbi:hypothetical protein MHM89_01190 [Pseudoalteromonas sp. CNC9-20]|uniref:hypothetical protein n=1 Tax=Pseudoalteromonas sp. CNC9-20 TaxID=2917750 RepID=UPI001EF60952|nr:hypothetical protein [Pseudoalteromonas sp. CNC9-20]MCG7568530.1 hypothetical protein [Pseudoalteromonas sp. CNC9-20]
MTKRLLPVIYLIVLVTGCSSYRPLPVDELNIDSRLTAYKTNHGSIGLSIAENPQSSVTNMKKYSDWYLLKATDLQEKLYKHSDYSLGFGVAGLIAGVAGSPEGAAIGALLASSSTIPAERYSLAVQAQNYQKASDTLNCMYRHLAPHKQGELPRVEILNDAIYQIRIQLRKLQSSITLADPDMEKLKNSLATLMTKEKERKEARAQKDNEVALLDLAKNQHNISGDSKSKATLDAAQVKLLGTKVNLETKIREQNEAQVRTCLATFVS